MRKHPKGIRLRITDYQQIAYNKIDALGIPHGWEIIRNSFQYILEDLLFLLFEFEGSIEVFFYLCEALMVLCIGFELVVGFILHQTVIINQILRNRYLLFSVSNLKIEAFFVFFVIFIQTIKNYPPFLHDMLLDLLISTDPFTNFKHILVLPLLQQLRKFEKGLFGQQWFTCFYFWK